MSSEPLLPPRVVRMGEALRPLLSKVAERTAAPAGAGVAEPATMEFLSHRLQDLEMAATRLKAVVEAMMADVVENEDAADSDVYRAVARLESRVDDLVDDRARLRRRAAGEFAEGACLLAGVYDGLLGRIETWLEDLVESIADPLAAIERKGLPTSGYVELPLTLNIGAPERVAEFRHWLDRESLRRETGTSLMSTEVHGEGAVAIDLGREGAEAVVLARLKRIGGAMRPTLVALHEELRAPGKLGWFPPNVKTEMSRHLDGLPRFDKRIERAGEQWRRAISAMEVDEEEADKAVARVARCVGQVLAAYREARCLNASGRFVRGRDLLALNYRQTLNQLEQWLLTTVEILEDPLAECERRGLPGNGRVLLLPELRLTVPPADQQLADWLEEMKHRAEADEAFWNTMIAVGAGVVIGGVVFDD